MQSIPESSGFACGFGFDSHEVGGFGGQTDGVSRQTEPRSGLDLIFGHLTTSTPYYRPVNRNTQENQPFEGWYCPAGDWSASEESNLVLKIQPFHAGGYEATIRPVCLPDLARMLDAPRSVGVREKPDEIDLDNLARSIKRSKAKARHLMKSMGADRLLTLTKREVEEGGFWSLDDWRQAWAKFCRLCKQAGHEFDYVAVPERHKKGNYHLHVALNARCNIKLMRHIWWGCCGGRGCGNVDIQYKAHLSQTARLAGLARYLSKYLTKQFGQAEFNKKRYWSSRHSLPGVVRVILTARDLLDGLVEVAGLLQLDVGGLLRSKMGAFIYPDKDNPVGCWFNWSDEIQGLPF